MSMQKITLTTEFVLIHSFFYMTPLHYACKNWFSGAVSFLIEKGADVNAVTQTISFLSEFFPHRGSNKISSAYVYGDTLMIFSLFIILINENYNVSPLHFACETSNSIIAKILLDKGANPNTVRIPILTIL